MLLLQLKLKPDVTTVYNETEIPEGCSIEIYGDTGSGFQKLNTDNEGIDEDKGNETVMKGNRTTFRWKAVLKGNEENTPKQHFRMLVSTNPSIFKNKFLILKVKH